MQNNVTKYRVLALDSPRRRAVSDRREASLWLADRSRRPESTAHTAAGIHAKIADTSCVTRWVTPRGNSNTGAQLPPYYLQGGTTVSTLFLCYGGTDTTVLSVPPTPWEQRPDAGTPRPRGDAQTPMARNSIWDMIYRVRDGIGICCRA